MCSAVFFYFTFRTKITCINACHPRAEADPKAATAGFGVLFGNIGIIAGSDIDITFSGKIYIAPLT